MIFGPHMENFQDIARRFLEEKAALQVSNAHELAQSALRLFEDASARRQLGENAKRVLEQHSGAIRRVVSHLRNLLEVELPVRAGP